MILNDINDANRFVLHELETRNLQKCEAGWINSHRNVFYKCVLANGAKKLYYLKYDRNPYYKAGKEAGGFKGAGVTINETIFNHYVRIPQADVLYALPLRIYHITHDDLMRVVTEPFPQDFNQEVVVAVPFLSFRKWATNVSQD